ncbi:hypothetical protein RRG08_035810 [Elysia crispata]|uniref:Laminin G domain-containing protein n=1 Tax=Elysia crispata TaxID=231223 RepID=A0AAE1AK34_9GAST|nr:hypothetical protein RRG08_035810 [Elysia crispata]
MVVRREHASPPVGKVSSHATIKTRRSSSIPDLFSRLETSPTSCVASSSGTRTSSILLPSSSSSSSGSLSWHLTRRNARRTPSSGPSSTRKRRLFPVPASSPYACHAASLNLLNPDRTKVKVLSTSFSSSPSSSLATSFTSFSLRTLVAVLILTVLGLPSGTSADRDLAYFNSSSFITIPNYTWDYATTMQVTFRTCSGSGGLLSLVEDSSPSSSSSSSTSSSLTSSSPSESLTLSLVNGSVTLSWQLSGRAQTLVVPVGQAVSDNRWYRVRIRYLLFAVNLAVSSAAGADSSLGEVVLANSSYNSFILNKVLTGPLTIGQGFHGCMYQGPGVSFSSPGLVAFGVDWDRCPALKGCPSARDSMLSKGNALRCGTIVRDACSLVGEFVSESMIG